MPSSRFKVHVTKDYLVFCSGHFITYDGDHCERIHGHNYRAAVEVEGDLDANHYVIDFIALKDMTRAITDELDHRMLLPSRSRQILLHEDGPNIRVTYRDRYWSFPRDECVLVPIANTTAELLADYIAGRLRQAMTARGSSSRGFCASKSRRASANRRQSNGGGTTRTHRVELPEPGHSHAERALAARFDHRECRSDQHGGGTGVLELENIGDSGDSTSGTDLDFGMTWPESARSGAWSPIRGPFPTLARSSKRNCRTPHARSLRCASSKGSSDFQAEWCWLPRAAVIEVQTEDRPLLHPTRARFRAARRGLPASQGRPRSCSMPDRARAIAWPIFKSRNPASTIR